jgi:Glyoxalase-like domain
MASEQSATTSPPALPAKLEFDHVWIVVTRDAPERAALERAGLTISPDLNRHDGQGTASVTAEFQNSYIELIWPDPTVSVAPGAERGVEKFTNRMNWRTSGWCPIGIGLHRVGTATPLPFPTWTISPDWMPKGTAIEILIARDDTKSPSFFIEPDVLAVKEKGKIDPKDPKSRALEHEIGVQRITGIRLVRPEEYQSVAAFTYLEKAGIFQSSVGNQWAVEITFDGGRKGQTKDLRPGLPLVIHY